MEATKQDEDPEKEVQKMKLELIQRQLQQLQQMQQQLDLIQEQLHKQQFDQGKEGQEDILKKQQVQQQELQQELQRQLVAQLKELRQPEDGGLSEEKAKEVQGGWEWDGQGGPDGAEGQVDSPFSKAPQFFGAYPEPHRGDEDEVIVQEEGDPESNLNGEDGEWREWRKDKAERDDEAGGTSYPVFSEEAEQGREQVQEQEGGTGGGLSEEEPGTSG
jgi:hypothetical protein